MEIHYSTARQLSAKAMAFLEFDVDSIRQVVSGRHGTTPRYWLADPEQYEQNGRALRDSTEPRLLAYSPEDRVLYANDGCNSCTHVIERDLRGLSSEDVLALGGQIKVSATLLKRMVEVLSAA
jgi:hypothetical protein